MRTQDGGDLDFDDTTGYGPEHWTLKFSNTVRWNQDYTVRVHYYSDHQSGETTIPSAWAVNIVTNEETPQATSTSYSGVLAYDSSDNYNPADSGADWADVAVVRPVQPTATLSAGQSVVDRTLGGLPVIRVAVPDPAQANAAKQAAEAAGDEGRWR
jgi:hypothetical protein